MARSYWDHTRSEAWYPFNYSPSDPLYPTTVNYDFAQAESVGGEIQGSRRLFEKNRLTAGAEFRYDFQLDQQLGLL